MPHKRWRPISAQRRDVPGLPCPALPCPARSACLEIATALGRETGAGCKESSALDDKRDDFFFTKVHC